MESNLRRGLILSMLRLVLWSNISNGSLVFCIVVLIMKSESNRSSFFFTLLFPFMCSLLLTFLDKVLYTNFIDGISYIFLLIVFNHCSLFLCYIKKKKYISPLG